MSIAGQVLAYLKILAWPATALVALMIFRVPVRSLLGGIQEFEGFGIKAKIGRQVASGVAAAAEALDESPVSPAPPANSGQSSRPQPARLQRGPGGPTLVVSQAQAALTVSSRLAKPDPGIGDDTAEAMRSYLNWLDTAVTAVVTVLATADSYARDLVPQEPDGEAQADLTSQRIERQFSEVTGVSGWRGVIESRDILRGTIVLVCGHGTAVVSQADARKFVAVIMRSLDQWQKLVKVSGEALRPSMSH
jgi:hypothetical protein